MTVEMASKAQWLEPPTRIMHPIIPAGIMVEIITGGVMSIIPTLLAVITAVQAILGIIIGKIYPWW